MNLPPTDSELRDRRERRILLTLAALLMATVGVVGHEAGRRACAAERAEAKRAQALADDYATAAHAAASQSQAALGALYARERTVHGLPPCRRTQPTKVEP